MFGIFKKKKKNESESTPKTRNHRYTLTVRNKHLRNMTPEKIWVEFDREHNIEEVFEDFTTWYEYKLNKPTYKYRGNDFVIIFHRDNISSIDISHSK